jgi:hypothetical protein
MLSLLTLQRTVLGKHLFAVLKKAPTRVLKRLVGRSKALFQKLQSYDSMCPDTLQPFLSL